MDMLVVYNKGAGTGVSLAELRQVFKAASPSKQVAFCVLDASLKQRVQRAVHGGCKIIIAAGGDGTVSAVVNASLSQRVTFGVIPLGTLNHFAKDIRMPDDTAHAVKVILDGHTTLVDVMRAGKRCVLNNASFGLYPRLVRAREAHSSRLGKWPALVWAFIKVLPRLRRYHVSVACDGKQQQHRALFVVVSNNCYTKQSGFSARSSLERGELGVYILTAKNIGALLRVGWRALGGHLQREPSLTIQKAHQVVLERRHKKPMLLAFDGEVDAIKHRQLTYQIQPKTLRVIVPAVQAKLQKKQKRSRQEIK